MKRSGLSHSHFKRQKAKSHFPGRSSYPHCENAAGGSPIMAVKAKPIWILENKLLGTIFYHFQCNYSRIYFSKQFFAIVVTTDK